MGPPRREDDSREPGETLGSREKLKITGAEDARRSSSSSRDSLSQQDTRREPMIRPNVLPLQHDPAVCDYPRIYTQLPYCAKIHFANIFLTETCLSNEFPKSVEKFAFTFFLPPL